jgi:hypothetical protein
VQLMFGLDRCGGCDENTLGRPGAIAIVQSLESIESRRWKTKTQCGVNGLYVSRRQILTNGQEMVPASSDYGDKSLSTAKPLHRINAW